MKDNVLLVRLWDNDVCSILWDGGYQKGFGKKGAMINFVKGFPEKGYDLAPLRYPLSDPLVRRGLPIMCREGEYGGLPSFLSDSLPDDWGNEVFNAWADARRLNKSEISPVDKLAFIGKRGMGALEFEPAAYSSDSETNLDLESLYSLALEIERGRSLVNLQLQDHPGIEDLMRVGTSAGGKHPKAIIAIREDTGEIRSGQLLLPEGFKYYLLKFNQGAAWPSAEVEYAYYLMAQDCGVEMMPSKLFPISDVNHFLTERFDRKNGHKIHISTLHALAGDVSEYDEIFQVCRLLRVSGMEMRQLYKRMVFNYLSGNSDDHDKNFSFLMDQDGTWHITPAYDLTFTYDFKNPFIGAKHAMAIRGKRDGMDRKALIDCAVRNDVANPNEIIQQTLDTVCHFAAYATEAGVREEPRKVISEILQDRILKQL